MKEGKAADKPIYNHVTGALDAPEKIESPNVSSRSATHWQRAVCMHCLEACGAADWSDVCVACSSACACLQLCSVHFAWYVCAHSLLPPAPVVFDFAQILVIEGLHPFYDERVRDLLDFKVYLDISDEIKFAW